MTPEELAEAKHMVGVLREYAGELSLQVANIIEATLNHIDAQAEQISDLMANCNSLRDRCWKAEAQIEDLKEKLLITKCEAIYWSLYNSGFPEEKSTPIQYADEARQQLAQEMPEVFNDDR